MYLLCRNCPTHLCHKCPIPIVQLCLTFVFHMVKIDVHVPAGVGAPPLGKQLDKQLYGRLHAVLHSAWTKWVLFQLHQQQADSHDYSV